MFLAPALAQSQAGLPIGGAGDGLDMGLSPECVAPASSLFRLAPLNALAAALKEQRPVRLLVLGSPSAGGAGSGPAAASSSRLKDQFEKALPGVEIEIEQRGLPGDITSDATERIMNTVTEVEPDLVIWKVGTNDALAKAEIESFGNSLESVLEWLRSHHIDVILIEPLYTAALAADEHFARLVETIRAAAEKFAVPIVLASEAGRFLSGQSQEAAHNQFLLHDLGRRCVAEYAARAIEESLRLPGGGLEPDRAAPDPATSTDQ